MRKKAPVFAQNCLEFPPSIWEIFTHEIDPLRFFFSGSDLRHLFPSSSSTSASSCLLCFVFLDHRKREERYRHRQTERSSSRQNSTAFPNILTLLHNVHQFQHHFDFLTLISILHKVEYFLKKVCQIPLQPGGGGWCDMEWRAWLPFPLSLLWSPIVTVQRIRRMEMEQQGNQVHPI